ncbi:MAG: cell division protein FtsW [Planctomycetes bacterium]|nr:cell division protein FtsW [Planctomycetota bacterium]
MVRGSSSRGARETVLAATLCLVAIGIVMVFSASFHRGVSAFDEPRPLFWLTHQAIWAAIGLALLAIFSRIDHRIYARWATPIAIVAALLLVSVYLPGLGRLWNDSRRWISIGPVRFQPSEFAKLATILCVPAFVARLDVRRFWRGFLPVMGGVFAAFALILAEPDLGTGVFVLGLGTLILLVAGARLLSFLAMAAAALPAIGAFVLVRWDMVSVRLQGLLRPLDVYQVRHSLIALSSGGFFGVGLGQGREKLGYLPEAYSDFIFACIGEELGFAGALVVMGLFLVLFLAGLRIAWRAPDVYGFLVAFGITAAIALQAAINIAVVTASAPTKGIPLPFITYGGSGLTVLLAGVGILLSIERAGRPAAQESDR